MRKLLILLILLPLVASAQYFPPSSGGSGGAGMLPSATAPAWAALYNYFGGTQLQLDWGNNWPVSTVLPNGNIFASLSTFPNGSCQTAGLVTDPFGNIIASKTIGPLETSCPGVNGSYAFGAIRFGTNNLMTPTGGWISGDGGSTWTTFFNLTETNLALNIVASKNIDSSPDGLVSTGTQGNSLQSLRQARTCTP